MLPENYKFHVVNKSGVTLDFATNSANESATATAKGWKYDSSGVLTYGSESTVLSAATDLADGASEEGADQDNGANKFLGLAGRFEVKTDNASANGDVLLMVEVSTDDGTTYPSDAADFDPEQHLIPLAVINLSGAQTKATNWVF